MALVALLGTFSAYRIIGYRVPVYVVAWPPAWHRIHQARADYYYRMALRSLAAGDVRRSYLALGQVYMLDPDNTNAARLLAQFAQIANPGFSDAIYARLLLPSHGDREEAAQAWFRALLARGEFAAMSGLSARMLREGAAQAPAWTQGLLFAREMTVDHSDLDRLLRSPGKMPVEARTVLALAGSIRSGSKKDWCDRVELALDSATTTFEVFYSLNQMIEMGRAPDVVTFLQGFEVAEIPAYDRESLELGAYSSLGWHALERQKVASLLGPGASAPVANLLAAHLIRHPDPGVAEYVFEQLDKRPLPCTAANSGAHAALLCMAGVNGLSKRMGEQSDILGKIVGGDFAAAGMLREFFQSPASGKNAAVFLPALAQLPLEVVYALTERYHATKMAPPVAADPPGRQSRTHAYDSVE